MNEEHGGTDRFRQPFTDEQKVEIARSLPAATDVYARRIAWWLLFEGESASGLRDPSIQTIAAGARVSQTTVKDRIARLRAAGVLDVVEGPGAAHRNIYVFRRPIASGRQGNP